MKRRICLTPGSGIVEHITASDQTDKETSRSADSDVDDALIQWFSLAKGVKFSVGISEEFKATEDGLSVKIKREFTCRPMCLFLISHYRDKTTPLLVDQQTVFTGRRKYVFIFFLNKY